MDELNKMSFDEIMKKMNELQQIEINWKQNKNPTQLRQAIKNLNLADFDYLASKIDDPIALATIVKLYFYKFFAIINMKVKDMIMDYKDNPMKLQELQQELQKILNVDLSGMNFAEQFSEDAPKEEPKTKEIDKKKLN